MAGWVYRQNNVPQYQKDFQKHDGLRMWEKARGRTMIFPYKVMLYSSFGASLYMMGRMVFGYKSWFGSQKAW